MTEERKIISNEQNQILSDVLFLKDCNVFETRVDLKGHSGIIEFLRKIDPNSVSVSDEHHCNGSPENLLKYDDSSIRIYPDQQGSWIFKFDSKKFFFLVIFYEALIAIFHKDGNYLVQMIQQIGF
uniref:Uncharacterized protein n=1 Tax=Coptotermes formosanus TaxID=36987 RepID=R4UP29_COPFO|nr:hypothetical protein [Coptotermes formosanus]